MTAMRTHRHRHRPNRLVAGLLVGLLTLAGLAACNGTAVLEDGSFKGTVTSCVNVQGNHNLIVTIDSLVGYPATATIDPDGPTAPVDRAIPANSTLNSQAWTNAYIVVDGVQVGTPGVQVTIEPDSPGPPTDVLDFDDLGWPPCT
jgi:hypothetical protein